MTATGGVQPYTWTIGAGALPNGLSLSPDGQVTGTPTKAGHFSFTVVVADGGGGKASLKASATIVGALTANFLRACGSAGKCSVEQGCVSVCGGFGYQGGGTAPYSYSLTSGSVPPGTYQYGLSLAGTFTATGTYKFKATVTDGYGATASVSPTFTVFPHIALSGGSCLTYSTCSTTLAYSGGTPGVLPAVRVTTWVGNAPCTSTNYPNPCPAPPITATVKAGYILINVGDPNQYPHPIGTYTVILTDRSLCSSGTYCSSTGLLKIDLYSAG